jgi:hypothetical protein
MKKLCVVIATCLALSACQGQTNLAGFAGQYTGFVSTPELTAPWTEVSSTISSVSSGDLTMTVQTNMVQPSSGAWSDSFQMHPENTNSITVSSTAGEFEKQTIPRASSDCFQTSDPSPPVVLQVCANEDQVSIYAQDRQGNSVFKLNLSRLNTGDVPPMETPQGYSLENIVARAQTRNFATLTEFQRVLEVRDASANAYLNLLPHFGAQTVLNVASLNQLNVLKSIGDLAPFLLPSHWIRAAEAKTKADAEQESWRIMDADGMNVAEGLALAAIRESRTISRLQDEELSVSKIRDEILDKEKIGAIQIGTSDDITSIVNDLDQSITLLQGTLASELADLAQAAGFYNPQAITEIHFDNQMTTGFQLDNPTTIDEASWTDLAIARSVELRQVDDLIALAQQNTEERYFTWLDPSGDPSADIGFGLPSYIGIGRDEIAEAQAQKNQVKSMLLDKLSRTSNELSERRQSYALISDSVDIQIRRVERIEENFRLGLSITMSDLVNALQDQEKADVELVDAEFGYYAALSRLNRLIYAGPYAAVPSASN